MFFFLLENIICSYCTNSMIYLNCIECEFHCGMSDDVDNSRIKTIEVFSNGVSRDVDSMVAGTSSNASDDERPLSAWFEGAQSLSTTDSSKFYFNAFIRLLSFDGIICCMKLLCYKKIQDFLLMGLPVNIMRVEKEKI